MTITLVAVLVFLLNTDIVPIKTKYIPRLFCIVSIVGVLEAPTAYIACCNLLMVGVTAYNWFKQ